MCLCGVLPFGPDVDPRNKEYRVTITFGRLDQNPAGSNTDKISEDLAQDVSITGYKVWICLGISPTHNLLYVKIVCVFSYVYFV